MTERRYSDEEVQAIFARAAEEQQQTAQALPSGEGTSLARLKEIAREAGLSPELVSQAAMELDQPAPVPPPTILGIPIGVSRTVELGRTLSDQEWEQLVVRLRETFDARGQIEVHGAFRTWRNGNLAVMLEPSGDGHRVRFRTLRGQARGLVTGGASMLAIGGVMGIIAALSDATLRQGVASLSGIVLGGVALLVVGLLPLPAWRRQRQEQMDRLANELLRGGQ